MSARIALLVLFVTGCASAPAVTSAPPRGEVMAAPASAARSDSTTSRMPSAGEAWMTHASRRLGYTVWYPGHWLVAEEEVGDRFLDVASGTTSVFVARVGWVTRDDWTFVISGWLKEEFHLDPEDSEAIVIDGEPGRLLTYHTGAGTRVHSHRLRAFPIHGGILVGWDSPAGHETADRHAFERLLASLRFD